MALMVVVNPKGGTGKSTFTCLAVEYSNYIGETVKLSDVDPSQGSQDWVDECFNEGRIVSTNISPRNEIVDTAGAIGSALSFLNKSDLIVVVLQPQIFDLKVVVKLINKVSTLNKDWFKKIVFVVNRWQNTLDQRDAVNQLKELVEERKAGIVSPFYLSNRPAAYSSFLEGKSFNFFSQKEEICEEAKKLMEYIFKLLHEKEKGNK